MGKCYASSVIAIAAAEIGYIEKASNSNLDDKTANSGAGNFTKYARDFDTLYPNWYNGKKQGVAWCDMFVDWCFVAAYGYQDALRLLCQPERSTGAGCTYSLGFYRNKGQFYTSTPRPGDQIFFGSSVSKSTHTGIVERVDGAKVYTIEGNTSERVARRTYALTDPSIIGYGRPDFDAETSNIAVSNAASEVSQSAVSVKGIDVSRWQGNIDWEKVKSAGIKFAMLRLGYGSADGSKCAMDICFEKNVAGAIAAGVDIGCYFYSYATSVHAAKKEAEFVIGVLSRYPGVFTYPVSFDIEDKSQQGLGKATLTGMIAAFMDTVEAAGYYTSVYANLNWFRNYLDDKSLSKYDHWLAQWSPNPTYTGAFGMWQYSNVGSVSGISGNVDLDIAYKDYPAIIRNTKKNGFGSSVQVPATGSGTSSAKPSDPAPAVPDKPATAIHKGSLVSISGCAYYTGKNIPAWVKAKNWYVSSISGDRAVLGKSEDGKNSINSPMRVCDIALVGAVDNGEITAAAWVPAVGDTVRFNGNTHYQSADAVAGKPCSGGLAKISRVYRVGTSKHPYHLIRMESGCTVYGWVDAGSFTKA